MNKTWIVARREFLSRVQKKTFLLTTILLPLLIFGCYFMIIYFSVKTTDHFKVAVVDKANIFNGNIEEKDDEVSFELTKSDTSTLRKDIEAKKIDAYLYIPADYDVMGKGTLQFVSAKTAGMLTQSKIDRRINKALEEKRFLTLNIPKSKLDSLHEKSDIKYSTLSGADGGNKKAGISYAVGMISGFLIYIVLFIYGNMVMRGVMEEKTNRIAEVIISSVRPFQLMMGKITGIGAVGLLQFIIWGVLIFAVNMLLPIIFPDLMQNAASQGMQPGGVQAIQQAQNNGALAGIMKGLDGINIPLIVGCFLFYFLGGYLVYSSLFAAVGSAINEDPQDAQSMVLPIIMPIIFAIVIMMKAVNDPNSGLAVFGSLFPLTSPVVMMARVAHGVPAGVTAFQLILSMVFLVAGFVGTTWLAGKIYRTGILMYGKKPSWKELLKWAFRKN